MNSLLSISVWVSVVWLSFGCGPTKDTKKENSPAEMKAPSEEVQQVASQSAKAQKQSRTQGDISKKTVPTTADILFRFDRGSGTCKNLQGEKGYNQEYLGECGDLRSRDLSGKDLRGFNLRGANLAEANLSRADLSESDLRGTDLWKANWDGTLFSGAFFYEKTRLPFELTTSKDLGMVSLSYNQLDSWFVEALDKWSASAEVRLPSQLVDTLFLGARFIGREKDILYLTIDKRSVPLFNLMESYGFDYYNTKDIPFFAWVLQTSNEAFIKGIIENGFELSRFGPTKTALVHAIESNQLRYVKMVLDRGAQVDLGSDSGLPPLYFALNNQFRPAILELLQRGAKLDWQGPDGSSVIDLTSDFDLIKILYEKGADIKRAKVYNKRDIDEVRWFKEHGADLDLVDKSGESLILKVMAGYSSANRPLLEFLFDQKVNVMQTNLDGIGIYGFAFRSGQPQESLKILKDFRVPPLGNVSDGQGGTIPFMAMIAKQFPNDFMSFARLLPPSIPSEVSSFVSVFALKRRHLPSLDNDLRELKSLGLFKPQEQSTLIYPLAVEGSDILTRTKLLKELGFDLNQPVLEIKRYDKTVKTTLLGALIAEDQINTQKVEDIKLLIDQGVRADTIDTNGENFLFYFPYVLPEGIEDRYFQLAKVLISAGTNVGQYNAKGESLTSRYFDLCKTDRTNRTDAGNPVRRGQVAFLKLLIKNGAPIQNIASQLFRQYFQVKTDIVNDCTKRLIDEFEPEIRSILRSSSPVENLIYGYNQALGPWRNWINLPANVAHTQLIEMFKKLFDLGMDPSKIESPEVAHEVRSPMSSLHHLGLIDLIRELYAKGAKPLKFKLPKIKKFSTPENACDPYSGANQKTDLGGCLLPDNSLWSMPSTEDRCEVIPGADGERYICKDEGATGVIKFDSTTKANLVYDYCTSRVTQGADNFGWKVPIYRDAVAGYLSGLFHELSAKQDFIVVQRFFDKWQVGFLLEVMNLKTGEYKVIDLAKADAKALNLAVVCRYRL
jgi:hypothetical protein